MSQKGNKPRYAVQSKMLLISLAKYIIFRNNSLRKRASRAWLYSSLLQWQLLSLSGLSSLSCLVPFKFSRVSLACFQHIQQTVLCLAAERDRETYLLLRAYSLGFSEFRSERYSSVSCMHLREMFLAGETKGSIKCRQASKARAVISQSVRTDLLSQTKSLIFMKPSSVMCWGVNVMPLAP